MALTITSTALQGLEEPERVGRYLVSTRLWTLAGTYATGGHVSTAVDLRIPNLQGLVEIEFPDNAFRLTVAAITPVWAPGATTASRGTIMFFWGAAAISLAMAEITNAQALTHAGRIRVRYLG